MARGRLLLLVALFGSLLAPSAAGAAPSQLAAPTNLSARAVTGAVVLSWSPPLWASASTVFTVTASPPGPSCSTVGRRTCTAALDSLRPERFVVTASTPSGGRVTSLATAVVTPELVVVVAGQSNATGEASYAVDPRTKVSSFAPPFTNAADTEDAIQIWKFGPSAHFGTGFAGLDTPQRMATPIGVQQVFGPEIGLARGLMADRHLRCTIVKVTYPGSTIAAWQSGNPQGLFATLIGQVGAASRVLIGRGIVPVLGGVVFFQGESDALDPTLAPDYSRDLTAFVAGLRGTFGPRLPLVLLEESSALDIAVQRNANQCLAQGCDAETAGDLAVRSADAALAASLSRVTLVDSAGLPRVSPWVHLSNVGERAIGREAATALEAMLPPS
jgi:Carbohydrate esterase, sialic acid-specific acetylesterase